jgi:hypothetical protein|tara:strand:+ start:138 stop:311 length:174 start_codon:yes stop_codon:yes gene_type:complete
LVAENAKLTDLNDSQESKLEKMKNELKKYEKDKRDDILQNNNEISNLKTDHEKILGK